MIILQLLKLQELLKNCQNSTVTDVTCNLPILLLMSFATHLSCYSPMMLAMLLLLTCTAIILLMCLVTDLNCYNSVVCLDDVGVDDSDQVDVPEADGVPVDTNHHGEDIAANKKKEKEKKQPTVSLRLSLDIIFEDESVNKIWF